MFWKMVTKMKCLAYGKAFIASCTLLPILYMPLYKIEMCVCWAGIFF